MVFLFIVRILTGGSYKKRVISFLYGNLTQSIREASYALGSRTIFAEYKTPAFGENYTLWKYTELACAVAVITRSLIHTWADRLAQ